MTTTARIPSEAERSLTQQRVAADPALSVWVAANAGSGKTRVLVDRVLRLMLGGTPGRAILCLTFTKAAAAEMANRLHRELGRWATQPDEDLRTDLARLAGRAAADADLPAARRLFARTLDEPGGLKIQTIHAFCQSLLARFPLEASVPPHFQVMDERTAAERLAEARDRVLVAAEAEPGSPLADALAQAVAVVDEMGFAGLVDELARSRGKLRHILEQHGGDVERVIAELRRTLGLQPRDTLQGLLRRACEDGSLDRAGLESLCGALEQGSAGDGERAAAIRAWLSGAAEDRMASFRTAYASVFLTQRQERRAERSLITKAARAAHAGAVAVMLAEQERVHGVLQRLCAAQVADATAALWRVAARLFAEYDRAKSAAALLDYEDLILRSAELLARPGTAPWVLFKLDGGIDHILVDEAQDTSPEQWAVIAAIAEEFFVGRGARERLRTVFAVGDEKQSIYSFQGADPAGFETMREHFSRRVLAAGQAWRGVDLALSFRSTAAVLRSVDQVFAHPAAADGVTLGERRVRHLAHRAGHAGLVEIWPTIVPTDLDEAEPWDAPLDQVAAESPMPRLAARIAGTIEGWLATGERLASRDRPVRPGDVLILVRRRNAFVAEMVRALKLRSVPVAGTDRMVLAEQLAVMDLLALGRFVLMPEDDLTLAVVLKGPLFGFSEELLFALAHGRSGRLFAALADRRDEHPAFAAAHQELALLLGRADLAPPYEFFAEVLSARHGRQRLLARLGPDAADPVDELLALALAFERSHAPSLQGFLAWLEAGRVEVKRDLEQGRDEVRVMTVHGAKGLEANIVFLPDTCAVPDGRLDPKLLWHEAGGRPVPLWPGRRANDEALCAEARERARRRRQQEHRRLLYVAMTRARDRLYVCGFEGRRPPPEDSWYSLAATALRPICREVDRGSGETGWRLEEPQQVVPDAEPAAAAAEPPSPLPDWALAPPEPEPSPPRPLAPSRPDAEEPPVHSPLGSADDALRFRRGRLIHRLLQTLPEVPPAHRRAAAERFLGRPAHGLDAAAASAIAEETLRVLQTDEAALLFGPASQAEVPLAGLVGGHVISGQVDRLVVLDDRVLIVDFKTNRPPPEHVENVPSLYLRQMAAYRAALTAIYPDRPVEALLLWTDGPRIMRLPQDLLEFSAP